MSSTRTTLPTVRLLTWLLRFVQTTTQSSLQTSTGSTAQPLLTSLCNKNYGKTLKMKQLLFKSNTTLLYQSKPTMLMVNNTIKDKQFTTLMTLSTTIPLMLILMHLKNISKVNTMKVKFLNLLSTKQHHLLKHLKLMNSQVNLNTIKKLKMLISVNLITITLRLNTEVIFMSQVSKLINIVTLSKSQSET